MKITRGKVATPVRGTFYGPEGIGKTTLASQCPGAIVLDTEDGSNYLDVARVSCPDWLAFTDAMHELTRDQQGFKTVVIDSADWLERLLIEHILKRAGKKSIEDFGFGKGYTHVAEEFARVLGLADGLIAKGINVIFVAHSKVVRCSPPDQDEGYDRWELKLTKQTAPLLKEWCDLLLFCNYRLKLVEGQDGRTRAKGGKERVMYAERSAALDAKNRFGLPPEMPMEIGQLAGIFPASTPKAKASPPLLEKVRATICNAKTVEQLGRIGDRIDELASNGDLDHEQVAELMGEINKRHQAIQPEVPA